MQSSADFRRRFVYFLLPGLYQAALPFLTLPLTTRILGPADFALFSVAGAISALLAAMSQLGIVFILAQRFHKSRGGARRRLVSTIFYQSLGMSLVSVVLTLCIWPTVRSYWSVATDITLPMMALAVLASIGTCLYSLAGALAVYGHAPGFYSLLTVLKATCSVIVVLVALFVFDLNVMALFLGHFAAGVFDLIGSTLLISPFLAWRFDRKVARDCLFLGGWSGLALIVMQGKQVLERSVLSSTAGLHSLGLFVHAQQYQSYAQLGARPIQKAAMPVMLEESDQPVADFSRTNRITRVLFVAITVLALIFAFLGTEFIHLLTNGKFDAAAPFAALLIAAVLLQSAGRPQYARLLSQGRGFYLSVCNIVAVTVAAGSLLLLAPKFGIAAGVAAIYFQHGVFRLGIQVDAWRSGHLPFQDSHALIGIVLVGSAVAIVQIWNPNLAIRAALLIAALFVIMAQNWSVIGDLLGQTRPAWQSLVALTAIRRPAGQSQSSRGEVP